MQVRALFAALKPQKVRADPILGLSELGAGARAVLRCEVSARTHWR